MIPDLLTAPTTSPLSLYRYRDGLYAADLLTTAIVEFDFFTWLDAHPSTLTEVCASFGFHPRPADVMLTLFVARGYVERDGGRVPRLRGRARTPHVRLTLVPRRRTTAH